MLAQTHDLLLQIVEALLGEAIEQLTPLAVLPGHLRVARGLGLVVGRGAFEDGLGPARGLRSEALEVSVTAQLVGFLLVQHHQAVPGLAIALGVLGLYRLAQAGHHFAVVLLLGDIEQVKQVLALLVEQTALDPGGACFDHRLEVVLKSIPQAQDIALGGGVRGHALFHDLPAQAGFGHGLFALGPGVGPVEALEDAAHVLGAGILRTLAQFGCGGYTGGALAHG